MIKIATSAVRNLFDRLLKDHDTTYDAIRDVFAVGFSIGESRASTRVQLDHTAIPGVVEALESWDPNGGTQTDDNATEPRTVLEIIQATLSVETDDDGVKWFAFKVSDAPKSRTQRVPADLLDGFVDLLRGYDPEVQASSAPADVVRRTLTRDDKGISFRVSDAPHTRAVRLDNGKDFSGLIRFLKLVQKETPSILSQYHEVVGKAEGTETDDNAAE